MQRQREKKGKKKNKGKTEENIVQLKKGKEYREEKVDEKREILSYFSATVLGKCTYTTTACKSLMGKRCVHPLVFHR